MTDEQNAADMHRDQATDDDSPHAHQAPERRSWTDTTISTLTARWPTVLALVLVLILIPVIVLGGADVELAPGPAVMAGIYMVAYALGRPAAAWAAWSSLVVVLLALGEVTDERVGITVVLGLLWIWAIWRGRAGDGRWFTIQTAGMVVFGAFTVLAVVVDPTVGGVLVGIGWIAHGIWDIYHFVKNKIVTRTYSECCAVVDIPVGVAIVVATLVQ